MELFFICLRLFGFGSSFEESDAVVSAVRCFSFLTFPDFPFHSVCSFSFWHYVRLCHYAALISALQVVLKTRLVDSLSAVSPNRGLQALTWLQKNKGRATAQSNTETQRTGSAVADLNSNEFQWIPSCILRSILDASPRLFQWGMHTRLPIAPCKFLNLRGWLVTVLCCMPHTPLPCQGETWHTTWSPRCKTSRKKKQERSRRKQKVAEGATGAKVNFWGTSISLPFLYAKALAAAVGPFNFHRSSQRIMQGSNVP